MPVIYVKNNLIGLPNVAKEVCCKSAISKHIRNV